MKLQLVKGRPLDKTCKRLDKELKVYEQLEALEISYESMDHAPVMTMDACEAIDKALDAQICKNLFLCDTKKDQYYLLVIEGHKKFNAKYIAKQIGAKGLNFGKAEQMLAYLDVTPGSVSILGLMNDQENRVQLLIDQALLEGEYVGCHPCVNTASLRIRTDDLINLFLPHIKHTPIYVEV